MPPTREEIDARLLKTLEELERNEQRRAEEKRVENQRRTAETHGVNLVLKEVQGLRGEVRDEIRHVREDLKGVQARVTILEGRRPMSSTPPGQYAASGQFELDIPASKSGQVKLEDVQRAWAGKLVELDEQVRTLKAEADAKERLRLETAESAEAYRKMWWFRIKIAAAIITPLLPALGVVAAKVFHL